MTRTFEFFFDFGSPASYLAWTQIPALEARAGATACSTRPIRASRRISKLVSLSELSAQVILTEPPPRFNSEGLPGSAGGVAGG